MRVHRKLLMSGLGLLALCSLAGCSSGSGSSNSNSNSNPTPNPNPNPGPVTPVTGPYSLVEIPVKPGTLPITMQGASDDYVLLELPATSNQFLNTYFRWTVSTGAIDLLDPTLNSPSLGAYNFQDYTATSINDSGAVVGFNDYIAKNPAGGGNATGGLAVLWQQKVAAPLGGFPNIPASTNGLPALSAADIDDSGNAVGSADGAVAVWLTSKPSTQILVTNSNSFPGSPNASHSAIRVSDLGNLVISTNTLNNPGPAFTPYYFYDGTNFTDMNVPQGGRVTGLSRGAAVACGYSGGFMQEQAFKWQNGQLTNLPPLNQGEATKANAVSYDGSFIVGSSGGAGVLWDSSGAHSLSALVTQPSGVSYTIGEAFGISRRNSICALATLVGGSTARVNTVDLQLQTQSKAAKAVSSPRPINPAERARDIKRMQDYLAAVQTACQKAHRAALAAHK